MFANGAYGFDVRGLPYAHGDRGNTRSGAVCKRAAIAEPRAARRIRGAKANRMNSIGQKMKACVIGGSGFLGSHVCDHLSDAGYAVSILDQVASPWLRADQKMLVGDLRD